ncbi:MAG: M3 family metallopeptidase [Bryobacteraceae bacterium]|nr:M3 family metallopeptidase [Bryobacteraceae bacterium]
MPQDNPLLNLDFRIQFQSIDAAQVLPALEILLAEANRAVDALASESYGARTFANTLTALEQATERLEEAMSVVRHLEGVSTSPELRAAYNAAEPLVSEFLSSIPLNPGLWKAVKAVAASPEAAALDPVRRRFLKKTVDGFRRHGAELDDDGKRRLQELEVELSRITTKYSENVLDSTNAFEYLITDEARLAGLPPSAIAAARQSAESKGQSGWRFTLQGPSYSAILTYLDDAAIREHFYRANVRRAASEPFDNRELVERILTLRHQKAHLLGYFNFADLVLEERMAKRGARALEFLYEMASHSQDRFLRENRDLHAFRRKLEGDAAPEPQPWDVGYYAEKLRHERYEFDEEELRPYFPLPQVVRGMFALTESLFGIRVVPREGVPVWHPDVQCHDILDADGTLLGSFYSDWHPRETKRGGAWMDALRTGGPEGPGPEGAGFRPHIGIICGNLTGPIGDAPALLTHREVETVFHEFGHLLHHCLSRVEVRSLAGTNVAWDFVELPSQIMENWCWEKEALDLFARHHETNATIPAELLAKMKRARAYRAANGQMRQLGFGIVDLQLHIDFDPKSYREKTGGDVIQYARECLQRYSPAELPTEHASICSFTHLFSSPVAYGSGYYSYKWAEVLDADAFGRFREEGVLNPATGRAFREQILEKGDSEDPADLYRAFRGREPDQRALLERQGLLTLQTD